MACMKDGFAPGTVLDGRYKALSPLNHGSFGMVLLAKDQVTGDEVAIKCLSKAAATKENSGIDVDDSSVEIACHEVLGQHPNIVNLIRHFETTAHIYLVLEYCSMGDLYESIRLDRGPRETKNVQDFMFQLVDAVDFMHSKGFYHRDIKPENIFLTHDGSMKLGDLGLATSDAWSHEASVGSDRYMAPEQYAFSEQTGYAPAKADVWAIGICLLNVLFSRNPFVTPTESDKLFADFVRDNQSLFDIFPNMSQDTFDVLVHAMAIDPSKRSMAGVRLALAKVVNFTTDDDVLDDFCTETRDLAPATANREPLRTPSISSPLVDQGGAFPWSKALHMSPRRQTRQLSTVLDNESYSEDLFPESEKDRTSWYSAARNSSITSGLDSNIFGTSYKSIPLRAPVPRNPPRTKAVPVPSSLPSRMANLSSLFGRRGNSVAKSWTDIWDEDEEDLQSDIREQNNRTWSQESKDDDPTLRRGCISVLDLGKTTVADVDETSPVHATDGASENEVFVFEESTSDRRTPLAEKSTNELLSQTSPSPPPRRTDSPLSKRNIMDKWAALGNRRRQFNNDQAAIDFDNDMTTSSSTTATKSTTNNWMNTRDWRAGFGLKVFYGNGGHSHKVGGFAWDRGTGGQKDCIDTKDKDGKNVAKSPSPPPVLHSITDRKEFANAKVRNWRQKTLDSSSSALPIGPASPTSPHMDRVGAVAGAGAGVDIEWVGGSSGL